MGRFIVVTGLPASGKSTVARELAQSLGLPMLDKDDFLESLFEDVIVDSAQRRRELSRTADDDFRRRAEQSRAAVLTSWWKHPQSSVESGTPTRWLESLPGPRVEVHCDCSPAIATGRFVGRRRHRGHLDGRWTHADLLDDLTKQSKLGPLGIGTLVEVNPDADFELDNVVRDIERAFEGVAVDIHRARHFGTHQTSTLTFGRVRESSRSSASTFTASLRASQGPLR